MGNGIAAEAVTAEGLKYLYERGAASEQNRAQVKCTTQKITENLIRIFAVYPNGEVHIQDVPTELGVRPVLSRITDLAMAIRKFGDVLNINAEDEYRALQVVVDGLGSARVSWFPGMRPDSGAEYRPPLTRSFADLRQFVAESKEGVNAAGYSEFIRENDEYIEGAETILDLLRSIEIQVRRSSTLGEIAGSGEALASITVKQGDSESRLNLPKGFVWTGAISLDDDGFRPSVAVRTVPYLNGDKLFFRVSLEDEGGLAFQAKSRVQELIAAALSDFPKAHVLMGA